MQTLIGLLKDLRSLIKHVSEYIGSPQVSKSTCEPYVVLGHLALS